MKLAPAIIVAVFLGLAALTFVPAPADTVAEAGAYFTGDEIELGVRFAAERRLLFWGQTFAQLTLMLALVFTNAGRRLTAWCQARTGGLWLLTLLTAGAVYYALLTICAFPFDVARWWHLSAWDMTSQPFAAWLGDRLLGLALTGTIEAIVLVGLYLLMHRWPRGWWAPAALGAAALAAAFAWLLPVAIAPLFNTFTPLRQTEWAGWEKPLRRIAERGNVSVEDIFVMDASRQSHHSNAYFTGFGATQRIVLFDNLLKKHTLPEIESVLAHELGHWLHSDIARGIALGGVAALAGLFVLSRILLTSGAVFGLERPSDPAGLPLVILLLFLGNWLALPASMAVSRHFERQADQVALDLGRQPEAFSAAEIKLVRDNKGNPAPAPWNVWLFGSHPPPLERIRMAERWREDQINKMTD